MRILLVAYFFEAAAGGGIIVARLLREQLEARGHTVDVLCLGGSSEVQSGRIWRVALPKWTDRHSNRVRQTFLFLNNRAFDRWIYQRAQALPLNDPSYDFILAQDFLGLAVVRKLAADLNVPCGATLHDTLPQQISVGAPQPWARAFLNTLGRRRDHALASELQHYAWLAAISRHVRDSAERWLQPFPPPLPLVYNPAPPAFRQVPPPTTGTALRFLFVGRLSPEKGIDLLIEAFRRMPGPHQLTVLGLAGSLTRLIQERAAGDSRITLRPAVSYSEMPAVYAQHHVVCCPVMWDEPFGLTVLEGRVTQRVVIGTYRGGLPEILEGYPRSRLVEVRSLSREACIAHLARALAEAPQLLATPLDDAQEAAFLNQFSLSTFTDRYEALITEAVFAKRKSRAS